MSTYAAGILAGIVALLPLALGARHLQRAFLPQWSGAAAAVAITTMVVFAIVAVSEILGTLGAFRRIPVCVALAGAGVGADLVRRSRPQSSRRHSPPRTGARFRNGVAALAVGLVAGAWFVRTSASLRHGMESADTLWYHMPTAARFVQSASTTGIHYVDPFTPTAFYPATSALIHAIGIQLFHNDLLSPTMNLGWLALALIASWSIGARHGVGPVTLVAVAIVLCGPGFVAGQAGTAYTDVAGLALLIAAVALLLEREHACSETGAERVFALVVAALAAGLAAGTKFTLLAPVAALTIAVFVMAWKARVSWRRCLAEMATWCGVVFVAGGYFYLRNWAAVGNPFPPLSFGPLGLPTQPDPPSVTGAELYEKSYAVAQYFFRGSIWRTFYLPGLEDTLGPAWWAIVGGAVGGAILAISGGRTTLERMLGVAALGAMLAYLFTPQYLGVDNAPIFFAVNLRYMSPGLALGMCLLAIAPPVARQRWAIVALAAVLAVTQIGTTLWSWGGEGTPPFTGRVVGADLVVAVGLALVVTAIGLAVGIGWLPTRGHRIALVSVAAAALVVAGYPLEQAYLRHRYTTTAPTPALYRWARDQEHVRIAVNGTDLQYPFYGNSLTNYVQYIGHTSPEGWFEPITTCPNWRTALNAGRYDYVVIAPRTLSGRGTPDEVGWTSSDPHAQLVMRDGNVSLFRLNGSLDPAGCR